MAQVSFVLLTSGEDQEKHIALLYEMGVESFIQNEDTIEAFVDQDLLTIQDEIELYCVTNRIAYSKKQHDERDWNAVWESEFQPIKIKDSLLVRAPFHETDRQFKHELIIAPKMAFGTGHHETTSMILEWMVTEEFSGMNILDFGCGTGILGIFSLMKGARAAVFMDNDALAVENTRENLAMNNLPAQEVLLGDAHHIPKEKFDCIFANITRNVLIECLPVLAFSLKSGGIIALSGFLEGDGEVMELQLNENGLQLKARFQKADWMCFIAGT